MRDTSRFASLVSVLVLSLAWSTSSIQATTVKVANLQDLIEQSDRIFLGRCLTKEADTSTKAPFTRYTFEVIDRVKGVGGNTVTVRQLGLTEPVTMADGKVRAGFIPGMPIYEPGKEVLLFLIKESPIGLSSPSGFGQGVFRVVRYGDKRSVINEVNNTNLGRGLSPDWLRSKGLPEERVKHLTGLKGGPVDYEQFVQTVRTIARAH